MINDELVNDADLIAASNNINHYLRGNGFGENVCEELRQHQMTTKNFIFKVKNPILWKGQGNINVFSFIMDKHGNVTGLDKSNIGNICFNKK